MTEAEIQSGIAALYEATSEVPADSDDDYLTRRILMNRALHTWERDKGYWWDALWATDASLTVTSSTTYATPTNFRRAAGFVEIWSGTTMLKRYPVIKPNQARVMAQIGSSYAYFTGNPSIGYTLNLSAAPTSDLIGGTIKYDYYKKATEYTAAGTISEIPDPEYIIHSVVAELWKGDRKNAAYQSSLDEADERLKAMEVAHVANIDWQDSAFDDTTDGFGY